MKKIKVGSDFSGVGAFDQALNRLKIEYETIFACDMDKFARKTFVHNYGKPKYYPENVYDREIPSESLDVYMTSPPCQSFSLAGKRLGKDDERGILFFNSLEFIKQNKPRFFIFENVKGLLSDNDGKTFGEWVRLLGGKSVNANHVFFPDDDSVPYHIYWKVLNSKNYNVPQNRERVFIVGIRDDDDNNFNWPKEQFLEKKLIDVLEKNVHEKYFLKDEQVEKLIDYNVGNKKNGNYNLIKVKSNTSKGYEIAKIGDSINFSNMNSKTRRGRVGNEMSNTITTNVEICVPVLTPERMEKRQNGRRFKKDGETSFTITCQDRHRIFDGISIRTLTPLESFRLMDFPDDFDFSVVSHAQAYKQAGNSIVVGVLCGIIKNLNL
jgi:DNA (cytosine-5)-methyltransferase 1